MKIYIFIIYLEIIRKYNNDNNNNQTMLSFTLCDITTELWRELGKSYKQNIIIYLIIII